LKFAHFGDTHLGRTFPTTKRVSAFNQAFSLIVESIIEEDVDFAVHTGDLFDKLQPWPSVVKHTRDQLFHLQQAGIPVFIIRGNHDGSFDIQGLRRGSSIQLTYHPLAKNVHFIDPLFDQAAGFSTVGFRDFEGVRIHGLGYYGSETSRYLEEYVKPNLSEDLTNILLLHTFVEGYTMTPPGEPSIHQNALNIPLLKYVAVGHDHTMLRPIKLKSGTVVACSGSTERWDFREVEDKGFYVVDLNGKVSVRPVRIETDQFMTRIEVESESPRPPTWYVETAKAELKRLVDSTSRTLVVRVDLKGPLSEGTLVDIPLRELDSLVAEYKSHGRLIYFEVVPPQVQVESKQIALLLERFDVKRCFESILGDVDLAREVFDVYRIANDLLADDSNLTRSKNLKQAAFNLLLTEITKRWGVPE